MLPRQLSSTPPGRCGDASRGSEVLQKLGSSFRWVETGDASLGLGRDCFTWAGMGAVSLGLGLGCFTRDGIGLFHVGWDLAVSLWLVRDYFT